MTKRLSLAEAIAILNEKGIKVTKKDGRYWFEGQKNLTGHELVSFVKSGNISKKTEVGDLKSLTGEQIYRLDYISNELSPENLHCDGEISASAANSKFNKLNRAWKREMEALGWTGFEVDSYESKFYDMSSEDLEELREKRNVFSHSMDILEMLDYNFKMTNPDGIKRTKGQDKYKITCLGCGEVGYRKKASNVTMHPERYHCTKCGGKITVTENV